MRGTQSILCESCPRSRRCRLRLPGPFDAPIWDLVLAGYGRLRLTAEVFRGRTSRLVAAGGASGAVAPPDDPRSGPMGPPAEPDEAEQVDERDPARNKFAFQVAQAEAALFDAQRAGHYQATYMAYPILYGPRQPGAHDWCIVRRALDGRRRFILADGGLKMETRAYAENAAHATLLAFAALWHHAESRSRLSASCIQGRPLMRSLHCFLFAGARRVRPAAAPAQARRPWPWVR